MGDSIGDRLRAYRQQAGLSQRALARQAGVPSSSVSLLENGRVSPSVSSLKRLLDPLGITLARFFSDAAPQPDDVVFRKEDLREIGRGGVSYLQVGGDLGQRAIQLMQETYQPGAGSGKAPLSHAGEEAGIVIAGRLELTVDDVTYSLAAGDAYQFDSRRPHRFRNTGSEPCLLVSACTPPSF